MLLTPPEAAERLRVSLRMVYALMADGSITSVRIRRAKRIDEHELQRFIESCQFASTKRRCTKPKATTAGALSTRRDDGNRTSEVAMRRIHRDGRRN